MAVISLDLSAVLTWPGSMLFWLDQALTMCSGCFLPSRVPRTLLPSMATPSPLHASSHAAQPLVAALFQRFVVDQPKHPGKGVVRGDAVGQLQKTGKPLLPGLTKLDDLCPVVDASYDGAQCNDQYVQQRVALGACHAEVGYFAQVLNQAAALGLAHAGFAMGSFDAP